MSTLFATQQNTSLDWKFESVCTALPCVVIRCHVAKYLLGTGYQDTNSQYSCINIVNSILTYHIAGNFGEVFNLANWQVCGKSPNLKLPTIATLRYAYAIGIGRRQI